MVHTTTISHVCYRAGGRRKAGWRVKEDGKYNLMPLILVSFKCGVIGAAGEWWMSRKCGKSSSLCSAALSARPLQPSPLPSPLSSSFFSFGGSTHVQFNCAISPNKHFFVSLKSSGTWTIVHTYVLTTTTEDVRKNKCGPCGSVQRRRRISHALSLSKTTCRTRDQI